MLGHSCEEFEIGRLREVWARERGRFDATRRRSEYEESPKPRQPKRKAETTVSRDQLLEKALEEGLQETFLASDAVAVIEPAGPWPLSEQATRKRA
jgi:hypothetical protein